jgi:hypothetical protein
MIILMVLMETPEHCIVYYGWMMGRIHIPAMEPLLRTSPRALVSHVYSIYTLFHDSCPPVSNFQVHYLIRKFI